MGGLHENTKARLRRELSARRRGLQPGDVAEASARLCGHLIGAPLFSGARHLVVYAPRSGEVDPALAAAAAGERGIPTYYPRVEGSGLGFRRAVRSELAPGAHGLLEPGPEAAVLAPDAEDVVVLVPGVAFDRKGHRLGSGLGYYDRELARCPGVTRIGLVLHEFLVDVLPSDPWDVPMHAIVTERGLFAPDGPVRVQAGDQSWN